MPVDVNQAIALKTDHGLSLSQIGKIQGVSKQAIHQAIQALIPPKELIEPFQANLGDIISYAQFKALTAYLSLDSAEQKKMIMRRGMVDFGICYDKLRLHNDQSTSNVEVHADIEAIRGHAPSGPAHSTSVVPGGSQEPIPQECSNINDLQV